jgi:hypothetical protein
VNRLEFSRHHEERVVAEFRQRGFTVDPFGQALLTDAARLALRSVKPPSGLRWIADFIVWRSDVSAFLVDAKASLRTDTQSFSIELASYETQLAFERINQPVIFVFADMSWNRACDLRPHRECAGSSRGSGTPFVLVWKRDQRPFDEINPTREQAA